ncbi:hypothetical protein [Streptomyces sp. NPDC056796]|uniref:hypothetical protein n=1 Tax=Streptomyces sp. NPDC056796 TaxID=3345947 RepID=UPI00368E9D45
MVDDEEALTHWLMDLAELFARRGMAAEKAVGALSRTGRGRRGSPRTAGCRPGSGRP